MIIFSIDSSLIVYKMSENSANDNRSFPELDVVSDACFGPTTVQTPKMSFTVIVKLTKSTSPHILEVLISLLSESLSID